MEAADIDAVMTIERESFTAPWKREHFQHELDAPHSYPLVAHMEGRLAGYVCLMSLFEEAQILDIAVAPDQRGTGRMFANSASLVWDNGSSNASATSVTATEPNLGLTKTNDANSPPNTVVGGQPINYTLTATNNDGANTGISYQNILVDTLPVGMRGNDPVVTEVTRGGSPWPRTSTTPWTGTAAPASSPLTSPRAPRGRPAYWSAS